MSRDTLTEVDKPLIYNIMKTEYSTYYHMDKWQARLQDAQSRMPKWHFERYGNSSERLAAFPPNGIGFEAWVELQANYPIQGVCGPFYVI